MNKIQLRAVGRRGKKPLLVALKTSARVKGRSNEEESASSIQGKAARKG
jgi:hypothetical protein